MPPAHVYDNYYLMSSHFHSERQRARLWEWLKHRRDKKKKSPTNPFTFILCMLFLRPEREPEFNVTQPSLRPSRVFLRLYGQGICECICPGSHSAGIADNTLNWQHRCTLQIKVKWNPISSPWYSRWGMPSGMEEIGFVCIIMLKAAILFASFCVLLHLGVVGSIVCPLFVWQQFM